MELGCDTPNFMYPMKADIYYPLVTQNKYGQPTKEWVYDRTVSLNASFIGNQGSEDVKPEMILRNENKLIARIKSDPRVSSSESNNGITNILISNIRDAGDILIYKETSGPRSGRGTIYEIATLDPFFGPFRDIEYYKVLLRRSENQEAYS
jgi:hypothetical protein